MIYNNFLFFFLFFLTSIHYSHAEIIVEKGEYVLSRDISEKACFENAKQRALNNAATVITGEQLKSETLKICNATYEVAQCELYQSSWSVIDSVSRKGRINIIEQSKVDKGLYTNCEITIEVDLYKTPKPDPNFDFSIDLNQSKFLAGHEPSREDVPLMITINPINNEEMYINIFHWSPHETGKNVMRIFPRSDKHKYDGKINLISSETLFPKKSSDYSYRWQPTFPVNYNTDSVSQGILVFASRHDIQFLERYNYETFQEKLLEVSSEDTRTRKSIYVVIEK